MFQMWGFEFGLQRYGSSSLLGISGPVRFAKSRPSKTILRTFLSDVGIENTRIC